MSSSPKKKLPRNIKLTVAFLANIEKPVRQLFTEIFHDYLERFSCEVKKGPVKISVLGTEGAKKASPRQLATTIVGEDGRILVDIRDPSLDDKDTSHSYVHYLFMEVICHEFVHVMQYIVDPVNTFKYAIPKHNAEDDVDKYFFDPQEMEARILADYYFSKFGSDLLEECFDTDTE